MKKYLLLLLIILFVIPFSLAQVEDGPVTRPVATSSPVVYADIGFTFQQLRTQNAEILKQINDLKENVIVEVNKNNDLNMEFIDSLFYQYVQDSRKGIVVGVLGAGFLLAGIMGFINLRYNKKQYFVSSYKEEIEKLKIVIKSQKGELEALNNKVKDIEKKAKSQVVGPVLQPVGPYQPGYPQPMQQQPYYQQQGGNYNGPSY